MGARACDGQLAVLQPRMLAGPAWAACL